MDGQLRKELKKLDPESSYLESLHLGQYYRYRNISENQTKSVISEQLQTRHVSKTEKSLSKGASTLIDWAFLASLGVVVALLSILVDGIIFSLHRLQQMAAEISSGDSSPWYMTAVSFVTWVSYTVGLISASACFVHYVSPQAIGSGIPEMKTIIRGVILRDYLTARTLISKIVGVALSLGSGVPIGKMGPFVHIASVVANLMMRITARFDPTVISETRRVEYFAAACAVGVACTFSAPIGGVLFSIEATTMYFSIRSYWRGFFAACCGATTIRLLRVFVAETEVTVNAFYQTHFRPQAFTVEELPLFVVLGVICGVAGAAYISLYRTFVLFLRNNRIAQRAFQRHWIVLPVLVSFCFSIVSFRHGLGEFTTGRLKFGANLRDLFANCTFGDDSSSPLYCGSTVLSHWVQPPHYVLTLLFTFLLVHMLFSLICLTLPVPSGIFMPIFVIGATIGRLMGEFIAATLPDGSIHNQHIHPGVYAVVGAAAFSASVTHTVSVSVMMFEITGQLHCILPVIVSVVISNAVCAYLQPSFFDTTIKMKHLPLLPDIPPTNIEVHTTYAEDIMTTPVRFVTRNTTFEALRRLLTEMRDVRIFPVVDSEEKQMLVGTVSRRYLLELLEAQVGDSARRAEAERRVRTVIESLHEHFESNQEQAAHISRTKSETNLTDKSDLSRRNSLSAPSSPKSGKKKDRFLVVPLEKSHSMRRNAVCCASRTNIETDSTCGIETAHSTMNSQHYQSIMKNYLKQVKKYLYNIPKKEDEKFPMYDLSSDERAKWEETRLGEELVLTDEEIDPAPYHLVRKTSLFKIHTVFSMLQVGKAYVTDCGRLIGVVALTNVRDALDRSRSPQEPKTEETATLYRERSSSQVVDILTPTLEVVKPTAVIKLERDCLDEPIIPTRKFSSLRLPKKKAMRQHSLFIPTRKRTLENEVDLEATAASLRKISEHYKRNGSPEEH